MFKKNISFINTSFLKNVFTKKNIFIGFVCLFLFLVTYMVYGNIFHEKALANKNDLSNQLETKNNISEQKSSVDNKKTQDNISNSFNKDDLVNDNRGVPVLYYHSVHEKADNEVTITPENLKLQLQYIKNQGYTTLTMSELDDYLLHNSPIPKKSIIITFDDGYMDNYYNAFPILKELNMKATIFCITSDLDGSYYLSKEAIKEMSSYGIDIESHTVNHPKLNELTYDEQLKELQESKKTLESIIGKDIVAIAYPFGNFNDNSIKAAKAAGYQLGFTTNRGFSDRNDNPLKLDRIYISSNYSMNTFKEVLSETKK